MYPYRQYVTGDALIKAYTSYFFDKSYRNAVCKFEMTTKSGIKKNAIVEILKYDDEGVYCNLPPAYVIGPEFAVEGGDVDFSVSSNGEDFSNILFFRYFKIVKIEKVFPVYVLMD
jgi:hypothetical protein